MTFIFNRQLFAEAYLRELRSARFAVDIVSACRQTIKEWRDEYATLEQRDTLLAYLRQCFSALGLTYDQHSAPDYFVLYADEARARPLGLALAATDDVIGRATKGRHHQVNLIRLLREQKLTWGIVTNGHTWRLCNASVSAPYEAFIEGYLDDLLVPDQLTEFALFHRLFGHGAFALLEQDSTRHGLDKMLTESEKRTQTIEKHLKGQVESILQALCLGFVDDEANANPDRAGLDLVYRNAIYLLYRILFLFYAEARQLLPIENKDYIAIGLESIIDAASRHHHDGQPNPDPYSLWKRLTYLFVVVDDGDESLGIRPYNGGLFSDSQNPYLRDHKIADNYLAPALYHLAIMAKEGDPQRIDYRDLSVRHLGTLYEGLLEYRLNLVIEEEIVVREAKGKRIYVPRSQAGAVKRTETILEKGQAYFADDKGERKSSGSYYTPEDAVQYIVSQTIVPKLEERSEELKRIVADAIHAKTVAVTAIERSRAEQYADQQILDWVENRLLTLRILDPAMGSAHFLVAAGQVLTNFIVEALNSGDWANDAINTDPLIWKRRVVERCLYGVDVNPLSQELAKLALWLSSASEGKPLTFLDHHLKLGNSLYGAPLNRLATLPNPKRKDQQLDSDLFQDMFQKTLPTILQALAHITQSDSERIADVRAKDEAYRHAEAAAQRLRDLANVWLAALFAMKDLDKPPLTESSYFEILQAAIREQSPEEWETYVAVQPVVQVARQLAISECFFHWELEYADAVNSQTSTCQFDAVIANPPYVGRSPDVVINTLFATATCGDLYAWIFERALSIVNSSSYVGVVIPLSVMFAKQMTDLRRMLLQSSSHIQISSYDNIPDCFFNTSSFGGDSSGKSMQRVTVAIAKGGGGPPQVLTTDLLKWWSEDRRNLFANLRFVDTSNICDVNSGFPRIGNNTLLNFWLRFRESTRRLADICNEILSESRRPEVGTNFLTVPRAVNYFISATPGFMPRNKVLSLVCGKDQDLDLARVLVNSNVFYWYWRTFGDGFLLGVDVVGKFPVPEDVDNGYMQLALRLDSVLKECTTFKMYRGERVPSYNFNKRMDILLDIDDWIVKQIAPDLDLPRDIFAQHKSNSFLRPLDLSALMKIDDVEGDE